MHTITHIMLALHLLSLNLKISLTLISKYKVDFNNVNNALVLLYTHFDYKKMASLIANSSNENIHAKGSCV